MRKILDNLNAIWVLYCHRTIYPKHIINCLFWVYLNGKTVDENTSLEELRSV